MRRTLLAALLLTGCANLFSWNEERFKGLTLCAYDGDCPKGQKCTNGAPMIDVILSTKSGWCWDPLGKAVEAPLAPGAVGGMSLISGDILWDQQTVFGPDCILVTPMVMRAETNERRGEAVRDNSKPMCRIGECCSNPTVKIYPPCRQMSN